MDFTVLYKKVNLLLVDDDEIILKVFAEFLSQYPAYTVTTTMTISDAEQTILSGKKYHVCLMDLGMTAPGNDEFYLLKKYKHHLPFIVVSGSTSLENGANAILYGASAVVAKPVRLDILDFIHTINHTVIHTILTKEYIHGKNELVDKAMHVLFTHSISSVSEWANLCCVSETHFRRACQKAAIISPKKVLMIYQIIKTAFAFFNAEMEQTFRATPQPHKFSFLSDNSSHMQNLRRYYLQNKNEIVNCLSTGL